MAEESMKMCIRVSLVPSLVSRRVVNFAAGFLTSFMVFTYVLFCAFFQLQMSGDIKINPGPGPVKHPRLICCFPTVWLSYCMSICLCVFANFWESYEQSRLQQAGSL